MNDYQRQLIREAIDDLWYSIFEKKPNCYDMVIKKDITINDIKKLLQTAHIRIHHYTSYEQY